MTATISPEQPSSNHVVAPGSTEELAILAAHRESSLRSLQERGRHVPEESFRSLGTTASHRLVDLEQAKHAEDAARIPTEDLRAHDVQH